MNVIIPFNLDAIENEYYLLETIIYSILLGQYGDQSAIFDIIDELVMERFHEPDEIEKETSRLINLAEGIYSNIAAPLEYLVHDEIFFEDGYITEIKKLGVDTVISYNEQ